MVVEEHRNLDSVLECLASPIRLEILKLLSKKKLGYIELMENLGLDKNRDAGKFSYHLKKLQTSGLIELDKDSGKYVISREGLVVLDFLEKLEKNLGLKNVMMVWRSDGVIEPFDKRKIVDSLVREAGVPPRLAKEVATIAEEKLQTLKIEYLTSSLIRELVNTVLLDMGMEKYRYRLSRVGLPVYDVSKQLEESFKNGDMREFMEKATEAIMREYVMIDVLPRDIATMHVTGIVDFYPISTWFTGVVSRSYLTPLTEEENEELQIEIASNMLNIKHEINMKAAREGSLKNAFKIALNLCKKALMKNRIVSVTVNMDDLLNSCRDLSWMVKNSEKIDRFRMVIQVDKPYYRNLIQLEDISKEINLRYNVTNLIDSTFYGFKMPVEKSSTSLHIVLTINLLALALESGKDLDVFYNNLVNILTRCLTVLVKKTSLSKKIRKEEGDGNVIYIVSVCSLMETLKTMFGYNQILNISKELHVFIDRLFALIKNTIKDYSEEGCRIYVSSRSPKSSAYRMMLATNRRFNIGKERNQDKYSYMAIPPDEKFKKIEDRAYLESRILSNVDGGHVVMLRGRKKKIIEDANIIMSYLEKIGNPYILVLDERS